MTQTQCSDFRCVTHGSIKVRGNVFSGKVVSTKPSKTVKIQRNLMRFIPKYERYRRIRSSVFAHLPDCIQAQVGDTVRVGETRKLSKTKSFVVLSRESEEKSVEKKALKKDNFLEKKLAKNFSLEKKSLQKKKIVNGSLHLPAALRKKKEEKKDEKNELKEENK